LGERRTVEVVNGVDNSTNLENINPDKPTQPKRLLTFPF
jgi:hypothetical protein